MSTFDDATHQAFIFLLSHNSPSLHKYYQDNIEKNIQKWSGKYNLQQVIFMARVTAYVSTLKEAITKDNEVDWSNLRAGFPVYGPKFIPPTLESLMLQKKSISYYYLKPLTVVDPQLYYPSKYRKRNICAHGDHLSADGIQKKDWTMPKPCYGMNDMEWIVGITYICTRCKKSSTTSSAEFWNKLSVFDRPGMLYDILELCVILMNSVWLPLFQKKTSYSSNVVDYIRNHRLATTSRDLGNSLFMLYVKKYLDSKRSFYESLEGQFGAVDSTYEFSVIDASKGYAGVREISAKIINVVWLYLMHTGVLSGFAMYMRSLATEKTTNISWDATHSYAEKGKTIINNQRIATMKSLSVIVCNQNYIQSAVFTLSHRNVELQNQFQ